MNLAFAGQQIDQSTVFAYIYGFYNANSMTTYFSKIIKINERLREFNFRQLNSDAVPSYSVDVPDDRGNRVYFNLHKNEEGMWKASQQNVPDWVTDSERILGDVIEEYKSTAPHKKSW